MNTGGTIFIASNGHFIKIDDKGKVIKDSTGQSCPWLLTGEVGEFVKFKIETDKGTFDGEIHEVRN